MATLLKGAEVAAAIDQETSALVAQLKEKGTTPTLAVLRVGERSDDLAYERGAAKRCETVGIAFRRELLPADATQEELMSAVERLNSDPSVHGILVFSPLPRHLDLKAVRDALLPKRTLTASPRAVLPACSQAPERAFAPVPPRRR